jgi:DNA-binding GntR family transcriptional regulator
MVERRPSFQVQALFGKTVSTVLVCIIQTVDTSFFLMTQPLSQLRPRLNLVNEIVHTLRQDIIDGVLPPGTALAEPVLAKRFGVSRAPVREAMIELERAGLVQFETTGRTYVRTLAEKDIAEILEARIALESMGARLACLRWNEQHTLWIKQSFTEQEKVASAEEFSHLDIAMHEYIMKCSGNKRLVVLWQYVRWQFEMALTHIHRIQGRHAYDLRRFTMDGHRKVLEALTSRDEEAAAKVMAHHITGSLEWTVTETPEAHAPEPRRRPAKKRKTVAVD